MSSDDQVEINNRRHRGEAARTIRASIAALRASDRDRWRFELTSGGTVARIVYNPHSSTVSLYPQSEGPRMSHAALMASPDRSELLATLLEALGDWVASDPAGALFAAGRVTEAFYAYETSVLEAQQGGPEAEPIRVVQLPAPEDPEAIRREASGVADDGWGVDVETRPFYCPGCGNAGRHGDGCPVANGGH